MPYKIGWSPIHLLVFYFGSHWSNIFLLSGLKPWKQFIDVDSATLLMQ